MASKYQSKNGYVFGGKRKSILSAFTLGPIETNAEYDNVQKAVLVTALVVVAVALMAAVLWVGL